MRKATAWLLFTTAMLVWGFICALMLAGLIGTWTKGEFIAFCIFLVMLAWALEQAREWWSMAPWKLKL